MNPWVVGLGYHEVLGVHRRDNHETIAATRAKGVIRLGTITRWRVFRDTRFSFTPDVPGLDGVEGLTVEPTPHRVA